MKQHTFAGAPVTLAGTPIKVGDKAPDVSLVGADLSTVKLSQYAGKIIVLSSMPSMDTGVCQAQVRRFNQEATSIGDDVVVIAVSMDLPFAQQRFCAAEGLDRVVTLSDHRDAEFGTKYGFLMQEFRLLSRGNVVIDRDGIVRYAEYVPEVTQEVDFAAALAAIRALR